MILQWIQLTKFLGSSSTVDFEKCCKFRVIECMDLPLALPFTFLFEFIGDFCMNESEEVFTAELQNKHNSLK